ncbi:hypothetical protein Zmor_009065, partial [Zophobas morio]
LPSGRGAPKRGGLAGCGAWSASSSDLKFLCIRPPPMVVFLVFFHSPRPKDRSLGRRSPAFAVLWNSNNSSIKSVQWCALQKWGT